MTIVLDRAAAAPEVALEPEPADTLEIVVTLDDIRQGVPNEGRSCAFGLALQRAGYPDAWVGYFEVRPRGYRGGVFFEHTPESVTWVRAFDSGLPVTSERFVLHRRKPASAA